jgi:hypothetical protein
MRPAKKKPAAAKLRAWRASMLRSRAVYLAEWHPECMEGYAIRKT